MSHLRPSHHYPAPRGDTWIFSSHQELELLDDDANVFKALGPVLVKQDLPGAKENVGKRLEFIRSEMYVLCIRAP